MNRARLSDYTYHIQSSGTRPVIVIEDLNLGRMSVTNNIEAVVKAVCDAAALTPADAEIIYRDSEGTYDGVWEYDGQLHFYSLAKSRRIKDEIEAVSLALEWSGKPER